MFTVVTKTIKEMLMFESLWKRAQLPDYWKQLVNCVIAVMWH